MSTPAPAPAPSKAARLSPKSRAVAERAAWTLLAAFVAVEAVTPSSTLTSLYAALLAAGVSTAKNLVRTPPEAKA